MYCTAGYWIQYITWICLLLNIYELKLSLSLRSSAVKFYRCFDILCERNALRSLSPWTDSRDADRSGSVSPRTPVPAISRGASFVPRQDQGCRRGCRSGLMTANLLCKVPAVDATLYSCWEQLWPRLCFSIVLQWRPLYPSTWINRQKDKFQYGYLQSILPSHFLILTQFTRFQEYNTMHVYNS